MSKSTKILATALLLGLGGNAAALGVIDGDCDGMRAQSQLLERHPEAVAACESIVSVEGQRYLRMSAELRQIQAEQLVLRFLGASDDVVLSPGAAAPVAADAATSLPVDTPIGSPLRVYVPEERVLDLLGNTADTPRAPIPVAVESAESREARDARIANYTCCPRRRPWYPIIDVLPQTATPLPLIGMLGVALLAVAAGLARLRRARR